MGLLAYTVAVVMANLAWLGVAVGVGVLALIFVPWVVARLAGGELQQSIGDWYLDLAMTSLDDAALIAKERGGVDLVSVSHDPEMGADKVAVDGEPRHIRDDNGVVGRLCNKRFGVAVESLATYVTPLQAEVGSFGRHALDTDASGALGNRRMKLDWPVPKRPQLIDLLDARTIIPGNCDPMWGELGEDWARKSQEKFHERVSMEQVMILLGAFGVGLIGTWFVVSYGPNDGGGSSLPIMIGALLIAVPNVDEIENRTIAAVGGILACLLLLVGVWTLFGGILTTILLLVFAATVVTPPLIVKLFGPSFWTIVAEISGNIWFTLAQMSYGTGILVQTDEGEYLIRALREDDGGQHVKLPDGRRLAVAGDKGDLYRIGWRPFGVIVEKTQHNMASWLPPRNYTRAMQPDGGSGLQRQGYSVALPPSREEDDLWRIWGPNAWTHVNGSASSNLVENGEREALKDEGGQQQIGTMATMLGVVGCLIAGSLIALLGTGALL